MSGHLYRLTLAEPAAFHASGFDAAFRVQRRVEDAVRAALAADDEVIEVDDDLYLRAQSMPCDGSRSCRAGLHIADCERRKT